MQAVIQHQASLHANHLEASRLQSIGEVLGQGASLQANDGYIENKGVEVSDDVGDFGRQPGFCDQITPSSITHRWTERSETSSAA
jgi:hypothetical protein